MQWARRPQRPGGSRVCGTGAHATDTTSARHARVDCERAFFTPNSLDQCSTLSLIATLSRQNSTLYFIFLKRPPTNAARWMTYAGRCFSKISRVASLSLKSPSFEVRKTQFSFAGFCSACNVWLWLRMSSASVGVAVHCRYIGVWRCQGNKVEACASTCRWMTASMPLPTRPLPPVTTIVSAMGAPGTREAHGVARKI